jgi:hypothetical protein
MLAKSPEKQAKFSPSQGIGGLALKQNVAKTLRNSLFGM